MKKYLLAMTASMFLSQAVLADDPTDKKPATNDPIPAATTQPSDSNVTPVVTQPPVNPPATSKTDPQPPVDLPTPPISKPVPPQPTVDDKDKAKTEDKPQAGNQLCPDAAHFQTLPIVGVYTQASSIPARFDSKILATNTEVGSWTPAINGVKAKDTEDAAKQIKAILSHLSGKGTLKSLGNGQFGCEYTIAPEDLIEYANDINKPTAIATATLSLGNYFARF